MRYISLFNGCLGLAFVTFALAGALLLAFLLVFEVDLNAFDLADLVFAEVGVVNIDEVVNSEAI